MPGDSAWLRTGSACWIGAVDRRDRGVPRPRPSAAIRRLMEPADERLLTATVAGEEGLSAVALGHLRNRAVLPSDARMSPRRPRRGGRDVGARVARCASAPRRVHPPRCTDLATDVCLEELNSTGERRRHAHKASGPSHDGRGRSRGLGRGIATAFAARGVGRRDRPRRGAMAGLARGGTIQAELAGVPPTRGRRPTARPLRARPLIVARSDPLLRPLQHRTGKRSPSTGRPTSDRIPLAARSPAQAAATGSEVIVISSGAALRDHRSATDMPAPRPLYFMTAYAQDEARRRHRAHLHRGSARITPLTDLGRQRRATQEHGPASRGRVPPSVRGATHPRSSRHCAGRTRPGGGRDDLARVPPDR
jgi:hypothetical protein